MTLDEEPPLAAWTEGDVTRLLGESDLTRAIAASIALAPVLADAPLDVAVDIARQVRALLDPPDA